LQIAINLVWLQWIVKKIEINQRLYDILREYREMIWLTHDGWLAWTW